MQISAEKFFFNKPRKTELIEGRCTIGYNRKKRCEQQQRKTLICTVLLLGLHAFFSSNGLCEDLLLPRSSLNGTLLMLTLTEFGQLVVMDIS